MTNVNFKEIEEKWNEEWFKNRIFESNKNEKKKFYIIFAYPGVSGPLHVGHFRGYTYADVIARYKRAKGYNVLFPAGIHASGLPAIGLAKKIERGDEKTINYLLRNGVPKEEIEKLKDPIYVVKYFSEFYYNYFKKFGYSIDFRRTCTTIDKGYNKFIQWQFRKLKENGYLIQKEHYAPYSLAIGPVAVDRSETDLSQGGDAEQIEFSIIEFKCDDVIFPAATLRPETIFGVTNIFVNPEGKYVKMKVNGKTYIVSELAYYKFYHQYDNVELIGEVNIKEFIGKEVENPITKEKVLILPANFVNVFIGTGVVMSVPAHDCHDYIALKELKEKAEEIEREFGISKEKILSIKERVIINLPNRKLPAKEVVEELNIKSSEEKEKLEKAKQILYSEEYNKGVMNENCFEYSGKRTKDVKEEISKLFIKLYDFNKEVIDRVGGRVIVKKIPNQWFIKYSDEELKKKTKEHVKTMIIIPEDYRKELIERIIDWFDDRAACRKGNWLGTRFPFDEEWIIEPISDSTIYPAYYIIAKYINEGKISHENLNDEFFDYVFLGKGDIKEVARKSNLSEEIVKEIREEFDYYYPLDINLGGKEHKTVHFPPFLFNHIAIFDKKYWPRGIFVNWWVLNKEGGKISKSKGGAEPIPNLQERFGIDSVRLFYCHVARSDSDINYSMEILEKYKEKLIEIYSLVERLIEKVKKLKEEETILNKWILNELYNSIKKAIEYMDNYEIREYSQEVFFNLLSSIKDYFSFGKVDRKTINVVIENLIKLMQPITPHISEELWHKLGKETFVSLEEFPKANEEWKNEELIEVKEIINNLVEDLNNLFKLAKGEKLTLVIASKWKYELFEKIRDVEIKERVKIIREYMDKNKEFCSKLIKKVNKGLLPFTKREVEEEILKEIKDYLEKKYGVKVEIIEEESCEDEKGKMAMPGKFGIILS